MRYIKIEDKNTFYAPAGDECWVILAQEIMSSYTAKYSCQLPLTAFTQEEYDKLNDRTFAPIRRSILRNIKNGPLRNIVDIGAIYNGLEIKRMEYKELMGVRWVDTYNEDVDKL